MLQTSRRFHTKPLLHQLHWLPVQQRITYKLAVLMYKVRSKSTPVYLHRQIAERTCRRTLRSSAVPLLDKPFMRTDFSRRAFRFSAPSAWNSLPQTVLISDSLTVFKSRVKTFLFNQTFTEHWSDLPPAPLKLRPYGAIEIWLLLLLLLLLLIVLYVCSDMLSTSIHSRTVRCCVVSLVAKWVKVSTSRTSSDGLLTIHVCIVI